MTTYIHIFIALLLAAPLYAEQYTYTYGPQPFTGSAFGVGQCYQGSAGPNGDFFCDSGHTGSDHLTGTVSFEAEGNANLNFTYRPGDQLPSGISNFRASFYDGVRTYDFLEADSLFQINTDAIGDIVGAYALHHSTNVGPGQPRLPNLGINGGGFTAYSDYEEGGRNLWSSSSGYHGNEVNPWHPQQLPRNIIVAVHGWQPGNQYRPDADYLPEISGAIRQRFDIEESDSNFEVSDDRKNALMSYSWSGAFTVGRDAVLNKYGLGPNGQLEESIAQQYIDPLFAEVERAARFSLFANEYGGVYEQAYGRAVVQGLDLARDLEAYIDAGRAHDQDYDPTIHIIGHSLGTLVTADAISHLHKKGIFVDQVTLLDTPRKPSVAVANNIGLKSTFAQDLAAFDAAFFFWSRMPTGSVGAVENYYASLEEEYLGSWWAEGPQFGQPIAGSLPCIGNSCTGYAPVNTNHQTIQNHFYSRVIDSDRDIPWSTPTLYPDADTNPGFDISDTIWESTELLNSLVQALNDTTSGLRGLVVNDRILMQRVLAELTLLPPTSGQSDIIDRWQTSYGTVVYNRLNARLVSNSPSATEAVMSPEDLLGFFVEVGFSEDASGVAEILIDGETVYSLEALPGQQEVLYVSLLEHYEPVSLQFVYDSEIIGSWAEVSSLEFVKLVAVPEPASIAVALCCLAPLATARLRRQA